jgi:hypothetical protein
MAAEGGMKKPRGGSRGFSGYAAPGEIPLQEGHVSARRGAQPIDIDVDPEIILHFMSEMNQCT